MPYKIKKYLSVLKGRNIVICFFLFLAFQLNFFRAVSFERFLSFQADSQALVVGRLAYSNDEGVFSRSGLLGFSHPIPEGAGKNSYQYRIFSEELPVSDFEPYNSQPGMQGVIFGLLLMFIPLHGWAAILFLQFCVSLFTAIVFTCWIDWLYREWGETVAWSNALFIISSSFIVLFARNLYWVLGAFYIPFIVSLRWLDSEANSSTRSLFNLFRVLFIASFVKGLLTGFEYISTTCLMALIPFVYYGIRDQWNGKQFWKRIGVASAGIGAGVVSTAMLLIGQLIPEKGSLKEATSYLWYTFGKRSYAEVSNYTFDEMTDASIHSSLGEVLKSYFQMPVWDMGYLFSSNWMKGLFSWSVLDFILLFAFVTIAYGCYALFYHRVSLKSKAMFITFWISIIPPLSWLILFKGHSFVHTHMNAIVWSMPFLLWGIAWVTSFLPKGFLSFKNEPDEK